MYRLAAARLRCRACGYTFGEFTGTAVGQLRIPRREVAHLLYLFSPGVPSYRAQRHVGVSLTTMQRTYTCFREALYATSLLELRALSGEIELDESLFGGHRKGRRGWGALGKRVVVGLCQRNRHVLCFPVPGRSRSIVLPLFEQHTRRGSLFYTDDGSAGPRDRTAGACNVPRPGETELTGRLRTSRAGRRPAPLPPCTRRSPRARPVSHSITRR